MASKIKFDDLPGRVQVHLFNWFEDEADADGNKQRRLAVQWVYDHSIDEIFDRCATHKTAFFFKQWGTWGKDNKRRSKKANGRVYRDRVWDEMPKASLSP